jgi:hypothetical protein
MLVVLTHRTHRSPQTAPKDCRVSPRGPLSATVRSACPLRAKRQPAVRARRVSAQERRNSIRPTLLLHPWHTCACSISALSPRTTTEFSAQATERICHGARVDLQLRRLHLIGLEWFERGSRCLSELVSGERSDAVSVSQENDCLLAKQPSPRQVLQTGQHSPGPRYGRQRCPHRALPVSICDQDSTLMRLLRSTQDRRSNRYARLWG